MLWRDWLLCHFFGFQGLFNQALSCSQSINNELLGRAFVSRRCCVCSGDIAEPSRHASAAMHKLQFIFCPYTRAPTYHAPHQCPRVILWSRMAWILEYAGLHSMSAEVRGQGQILTGWGKSLAESRGRACWWPARGTIPLKMGLMPRLRRRKLNSFTDESFNTNFVHVTWFTFLRKAFFIQKREWQGCNGTVVCCASALRWILNCVCSFLVFDVFLLGPQFAFFWYFWVSCTFSDSYS